MKLPVLLSLSAAASIYAAPQASSSYDRAEAIRKLKERLQAYKPIAQQSRDNLSSLTSSVSKITSVLKEHAAKFENIEGNVAANSQTAADLTQKATQLEAAIVALTNAVTLESQRVDKNFQIVSNVADQEDFNNDLISENADDIEDVEEQVQNLASDLKSMKHDFTQYLDMNKIHLDNLIKDFSNFIAKSNPFYQNFPQQVNDHVIDLSARVDDLEVAAAAEEEEGSGADDAQPAFAPRSALGAASAPADPVSSDDFPEAGFFLEDFDSLDLNDPALAAEMPVVDEPVEAEPAVAEAEATPWLADSLIDIKALMAELQDTLSASD